MKRALYIGRFQPFHLGHIYALSQIVEPDIIIGIGSSQYSRTDNNPYTYEERKSMIEHAWKEQQATILAITDIHDETKWVEHVIETTGQIDIVYTGNAWVKELFEKAGYKVKDIIIKNPYSGTTIRKMIQNESDEWESMVPPEVVSTIKTVSKNL
ncbi:MAG: nicotinate-nucleotide adenylyltransferase [Candidatus Magasanikbacteria bacterium CG_4_9_14_0_2_um_filter_42_11]|uniref:Nicotinamide-nucleotide adenylyltransferase n=1 Tax=Candidatus Magasanikbacteria bacterium CG_4_9_14_0_2_um_filter_42_11 TaxID=1974643 RepID=A0A2M8FAN0_9BACT|nr:MAG: nicotinate-nucleotide adenylyltransferase [Candidatus Magasanikbacteria bacterium CG10_big_fil_rev_8_21_14_0_10_43_9]PIY92486.1 MAG: nicotinate-nucleotide adenylyltransferase [Candidatus Magasanikbacteria bacterium CG_4_10_14_0_8_um_filter_42_12]PJC52776.1 MAG: nicotinate-nucleotide adenylyltransferase [Candidatus Magasanikbacteria bacterium CG_4_9_14_0_2_um_filter_42_11]